MRPFLSWFASQFLNVELRLQFLEWNVCVPVSRQMQHDVVSPTPCRLLRILIGSTSSQGSDWHLLYRLRELCAAVVGCEDFFACCSPCRLQRFIQFFLSLERTRLPLSTIQAVTVASTRYILVFLANNRFWEARITFFIHHIRYG